MLSISYMLRSICEFEERLCRSSCRPDEFPLAFSVRGWRSLASNEDDRVAPRLRQIPLTKRPKRRSTDSRGPRIVGSWCGHAEEVHPGGVEIVNMDRVIGEGYRKSRRSRRSRPV